MTKMILKRHLQKNKKKGFTLIELIVVIVIIAIIAAIAVPALTRYIGSAEKRALQATAHNVQLVFQAEKTEDYNIAYTQSVTGTVTGLSNTLVAPSPNTKTYEQILTLNGIYLKVNNTVAVEQISFIRWDGNTLSRFVLSNDKYWIEYTSAGGFGNVMTITETPVPTT